jgi:hypothetical protein
VSSRPSPSTFGAFGNASGRMWAQAGLAHRVEPLVLLAVADHHGAQLELAHHLGDAQRVEHVLGFEHDQIAAARHPPEACQRGLRRRPLLRRVAGVGRLRLAVPGGVEQRLAEERDGAHQRHRVGAADAGLAAPRRPQLGVLGHSLAQQALRLTAVAQLHHHAGAAQDAVAGRHQGGAEAGVAQPLRRRGIDRQRSHVAFRVQLRVGQRIAGRAVAALALARRALAAALARHRRRPAATPARCRPRPGRRRRSCP